ncbi:MAG: CocE/NonD family hydrolase [Gemmatimonadota bacterium]
MIPMRDGIRLAADVYKPSQGAGPFPVIVERTPYGKRDCEHSAAQYYARRGYVTIIQDERGRYRSEGIYYWWRDHGGFTEDADEWGANYDGYDTIEWAGTQSWSTGKVGTMGLSMGCFNQYMTAPTAPPHLTAMFCTQAAGNAYKDLFYQGGALHMIMPTWLLTRNEMARPFRVNFPGRGGYVGGHDVWNEWYREKQLGNLDMGASMVSNLLEDMMANPHYNDYWKQFAVDEHMDKIDVPIMHFGSWYDRYSRPQLTMFNGVREQGGPNARNAQNIVYGPWTHGAGEVMNRVVGDLDFGPEAALDYNALRLRWFDYHLKGIDNGFGSEPPVRIFVMGENRWRFENEFPLARAQHRDYYFRAGPSGSIESLNDGLLSSDAPDGDDRGSVSYEYDPMNPVPTIGGDFFNQPAGARDHRPADRLSLTFTTPPLQEDTEITGLPIVEFYASSSAVDTDWVVAISDVHPSGYSQILRQNLLRASHRDGHEEPRPLNPGEIEAYRMELYPISNLFGEGHRIRVTITSSSFPKWFPNGNQFETDDRDSTGVVATNTIFFDRDRPSRITLPIIPPSSRP